MKATQPHTPGRRGSYKPKATQNRILAAKLLGKSNREIAREEGIDPHTVGRILSETEYQALVKIHRGKTAQLLPKALLAYEQTLDGYDPELRVRVATEVMKGTQTLVTRSDLEVRPAAETMRDIPDAELLDRAEQLIREIRSKQAVDGAVDLAALSVGAGKE